MPPKGNWRPFEEAREFAQSLGLNSGTQWREWSKSGERPSDIPFNPDSTYEAEWTNWADWLNTNNRKGGWRPFEEAREFARGLGLRSSVDWRRYANSGEKPDDIPSNPGATYKGKGWTSWGDFLSTGNVHPHSHRCARLKRPGTTFAALG